MNISAIEASKASGAGKAGKASPRDKLEQTKLVRNSETRRVSP